MDYFNNFQNNLKDNISVVFSSFPKLFLFVLLFCFSISSSGQKRGNSKDIVVRACTQAIGNGLYRVNFGYDNPNRREVSLSADNSFIVRSAKKEKSGALKEFKSGSVDKAFSLEFNIRETVEWTVINPSGKVFTVTASANSSKCSDSDILFPVYGQQTGKSSTLIGLELTALAEGDAGDEPSNIIYQINEQRVLVEIVPKAGRLQDLINLLQSNFGLAFNPDPLLSDFVIAPASITSAVDVFFPINRLLELNSYTEIINFVRPLYKPITARGVTASQGDGAQKTDLVREAFRAGTAAEPSLVDGAGVKIGVISDSYDTQPFTGQSRATTDVINGDLPGSGNTEYPTPVQVLKDYPYGISSDEGRAMLQILHDVAPGAELAFNTGILSPRDFEIAVNSLAGADCDIVVDDITFSGEPMFGESRISQAIQNFTSQPGKAYFTSAGNFANTGYQGIFRSSSSVPPTNFIPPSSNSVAHIFGTDVRGNPDVTQAFSVVPGTYMIVLQWNESMASQEIGQGAQTDLDIYVVDDAGNLLVGNNRFNIDGDPTEFLVFQATGVGQANILITSANGTPPPGLAIRYIAFRAEGLDFLEYDGAPTLTGHAMTPEAFTIGAVDYRNATSPQPQAFSSYGGNLSDGNIVQVDIANPDGGNTNVFSIGQDISADEDNFPNFFGTSAAAPHAAGAYALLMSALPSWYPEGLPEATSPGSHANQIFDIFKETAIPAGALERAGAGFMDTEAAFRSIANPTPVLDSIAIEDGKIPGIETLIVTISGKFFSENPVVNFDGKILEVLSSSSTEIKAVVEAFVGNPELVVSASSKTPGGTDGGDSNPLFLLDENRIFLSIKADDVSAEFGDSFSYSYTVEGLPEGSTLESLGLPEVIFSSSALLPYPDVNSYSITPAFETELTEEQAGNYLVTFEEGILDIERKDLLIKPKDATFTYGEAILIDTEFIYKETGIEDNSNFLSFLNQSYQSTYYSQNTLALANKIRGTINELDILSLLNGGSWISSDHVIQNKFRAVLNKMNLIDLDAQHFIDYAESNDDGIPNFFRGVINKSRGIVNGEDLINNNVSLSFENKIRPVLNSSTLGGESDANSYASVFAIIDEGPSISSEEVVIPGFFSLNLITGLTISLNPDDKHFIFPGAFLAPTASNFNITYESGRLNILPAILEVEIQDLVISQGEIPQPDLTNLNFSGFEYDETIESVFPDGVTFYYVDQNGEEYQDGDTGSFLIRIREPENYTIAYKVEGNLYINPSGADVKKVRTYLSCVEFDKKASNDLKYTANFRYENPNSVPIYVLPGPDNLLVAEGNYEGVTPTVFLPGQGEFKVRFDGKYLKWELTTFDSTHKTSTATDASSSSGKCGPSNSQQGMTADSFVLYPNPVSSSLYIRANITASINLEIFNSQGILFHTRNIQTSPSNVYEIDMTTYPPGTYILRLASYDDIVMFNILKN